jgi:dipeptidyl aminopeptidase/acylaminoacyl peptidase
MSFRCRLGLLILTVLPCFLGCEDEEVAWLPDSSGVIFRDESKGWSLYDLKNKAAEQILKPTAAAVQGIAISPKGDQFALGTVTGNKGALQLQITIYSKSGDVVQRSGTYPIGKYDAEPVPDGVWLEWSANGRIAAFPDIASIALYDPKTSKMVLLKGYTSYLEARYLGSNLIPDGSGLLAMKEENFAVAGPENKQTSLPNVEVVDWQGRVRTIRLPATPPVLQAELNNPDRKTATADYAAWNNQTLRLQMGDFRLDLDTRTSTARWSNSPLKLNSQIPDLDPKVNYALLPVGDGGVYVFNKSDPGNESLEVLNTKTKAIRVLAKKIRPEGALRSPDGAKIALTYLEPIPDKGMSKRVMLIVDQTGETIATIERGEVNEVVGAGPPPAVDAPDAPAPTPAAPAPK